MSLLRKTAGFLGRSIKAAAEESVLYDRPGVGSVLIGAIPGRHENTLDEIAAEQTSARDFDWLVLSADLVIDSNRIDPQPGDVITWTDPEDFARVYRVVGGSADRCFRPSDQLGVIYRIHTVFVESNQVLS